MGVASEAVVGAKRAESDVLTAEHSTAARTGACCQLPQALIRLVCASKALMCRLAVSASQ